MIGKHFVKMSRKQFEMAPQNQGTMHCFVDVENTGNKVTRRSQLWALIFINRAPIIFFIKKKETFKISTFGTELIPSRIATEMIEYFRCNLRMFGVLLNAPTHMFIDNELVKKHFSP